MVKRMLLENNQVRIDIKVSLVGDAAEHLQKRAESEGSSMANLLIQDYCKLHYLDYVERRPGRPQKDDLQRVIKQAKRKK